MLMIYIGTGGVGEIVVFLGIGVLYSIYRFARFPALGSFLVLSSDFTVGF